ncbi:hypothetical protein QMO56_19545 [Roseomonas sp. E05]|uniref:hypothetical protein n=1 Tax=Roseomonas sp. E05 TaxID=3046310 RepID=UPI0024B88209|nr:hypothetical protein [Roseomonas sp. E05]MDJ0390310.1 hypothetical protein [Roseomonas sp. E05]
MDAFLALQTYHEGGDSHHGKVKSCAFAIDDSTVSGDSPSQEEGAIARVRRTGRVPYPDDLGFVPQFIAPSIGPALLTSRDKVNNLGDCGPERRACNQGGASSGTGWMAEGHQCMIVGAKAGCALSGTKRRTPGQCCHVASQMTAIPLG